MNERDEGLRRELAELPTEIEPARDLWGGIEARLDKEQGNGTPQDQVTPISSARSSLALRGRRIPVEWALAASVVLASVAGGTIWASMRAPGLGSPLTASADSPATDALSPDAASFVSTDLSQYETAAAELGEIIETGRELLGPQTLEVLESSLTAIDQAIAEAQEALSADPGHERLQRMLQQNHRRKLGLLRQVATAVQSRT